MREYKLIALDMDGTLLDSKGKVTEKSIEYIKRASDAGKVVVLSTGRNIAELREHLEVLPSIKYLICTSGSYICDLEKNHVIYRNPLKPEEVLKILEVSEKEDTMVHFLHKESVVQRSKFETMERYQMSELKEMFDRVAVKPEDLIGEYRENPVEVDKLLMYHTDAEARERSKKRLIEEGLDLMFAYAWTTSLECSPKGVDKGIGLERLCDYLGIDLKDTIIVGDADNDRGSFEVGGLKIAVDNATKEIKEMADVIVASNDEEGCAEAIGKYLLKE